MNLALKGREGERKRNLLVTLHECLLCAVTQTQIIQPPSYPNVRGKLFFLYSEVQHTNQSF